MFQSINSVKLYEIEIISFLILSPGIGENVSYKIHQVPGPLGSKMYYKDTLSS